MDVFETINLDTQECKIRKQQTGEELISCILHEMFLAPVHLRLESRPSRIEFVLKVGMQL